jgi:hypothetical protein
VISDAGCEKTAFSFYFFISLNDVFTRPEVTHSKMHDFFYDENLYCR